MDFVFSPSCSEYLRERERRGQAMEAPNDEESDNQLSAEFYYESATLHSRPFITPKSDIPENLLHLWYADPYGFNSSVHFRQTSFKVCYQNMTHNLPADLCPLVVLFTAGRKYKAL